MNIADNNEKYITIVAECEEDVHAFEHIITAQYNKMLFETKDSKFPVLRIFKQKEKIRS